MRNYYFEDIDLTQEQSINCSILLSNLSDVDYVFLMMDAVRTAHKAAQPPITPDSFWESLFVGTKKPLLEDGKQYSRHAMRNDPYEVPDLVCWIKYLYYGSDHNKSVQICWEGTDAVIRFFKIGKDYQKAQADYMNKGYAKYQKLQETYADQLKQMQITRNIKIGHKSPLVLLGRTMRDLTDHRNTLLALLEPFCKKEWSGKQKAEALFEKTLREFYAQLGPVDYTVALLMRYAKIAAAEQPQVEKLLTDAGLSVKNGKVTLSMDPTTFTDELALVWKQTDLSPERRVLQLKLRLPGNENLIKDLILKKTGDNLQSLSAQALDELLSADDPKAQFEKARRLWNAVDHREENRAEAVKLLQKAADKGYALAQVNLALRFEKGEYVKQDLDEMVYWLRTAARNGNSSAHFYIGRCYERGIGVTKDKNKAFACYQNGAQAENTDCLLAKARCMMEGIGTQPDLDAAVFEYQTLDRKGVAEASWHLANYYEKDTTRPGKWLDYLKRAAANGYAAAQYKLGCLYHEGSVLPKDEVVAVRLFEKAAFVNDGNSQYRLGLAYKDGTGGKPKDDAEAFRWFQKAAEQNHIEGNLETGCCYLKGVGVEKDTQKACKHLLFAANKENARAQYLLGCVYLSDDSPNSLNGPQWLQKAMEHGSAAAALRLAEHYEALPVKNNEWIEQALQKAGDLGDAEGYYRLSFLLEKRQATPHDAALLLTSFDLRGAMGFSPPKKLTFEQALRKASDMGHVAAMERLAGRILEGKYKVSISPYPSMKAAAQGLLEKAAKQGSATAACSLGELLQEAGEITQARPYFESAAKTVPAAACHLAKLLQKEGDHSKARMYLQQAADIGQAEAQLELFYLYRDGCGVGKDPVEAIKWLGKAADSNLAKAVYELGRCYETGLLVKVDTNQALELYQKAGRLGEPEGYYRLAKHYAGQKKSPEAFVYYRAIAERYPAAAFELGKSLLYTEKKAEALDYLRKAADKGYAEACHWLGRFYAKGAHTLPKDANLALEWYNKALADSGYRNRALLQKDIAELPK